MAARRVFRGEAGLTDEPLDGFVITFQEDATGGDNLPREGRVRGRQIDDVDLDACSARDAIGEREPIVSEDRAAQDGEIDVGALVRGASRSRAEEPDRVQRSPDQLGRGREGVDGAPHRIHGRSVTRRAAALPPARDRCGSTPSLV